MGRMLQFAPLIGLMAVSACETMQGAGRDMQSAGALLTEQSANTQTQMGQTPGQPYVAPGGAAYGATGTAAPYSPGPGGF
ncbi:entericidin A/B family lipoprotein [Paracoccus shanxieyensis]|uniref:Entericidin A/B family lipoprotein n=1 Tax=Paracoccus shanxieyensis TaxID=2675752 RepID=A0A6L6IXW8_9RHOB|nr:entericidin A/B family lipoprotein [Paracoccus shanxieyensis]MTH64441.1 entericidin A/B family lipoprotein [Paracoccus shanxieyensis]MTH87566.1 entericidin A/B family lipoprotein [Paracoccus shanxieyensis]